MLMVPPVALGAVPDVAAEIVPPFWTVKDCAAMLVLPAAPVPTVFVRITLLEPSIKTELALLPSPAKPWTVMVPPLPVGIGGGGSPRKGGGAGAWAVPLLILPPFVT